MCGERKEKREGRESSEKRRGLREEREREGRKAWGGGGEERRRGIKGNCLPGAIVTDHKDCTVIVVFIITILIIPAH